MRVGGLPAAGTFLAVAAVCWSGLSGCDGTDPLYRVDGAPVFQVPMRVLEDVRVPRGQLELEEVKLTDFDRDVPDAFGRATPPPGIFGYGGDGYVGVASHGSNQDPLISSMHPLAPNTGETFGPDQYNYLVVYEADYATGEPLLDRVVMRRQVGPDLDVAQVARIRNNAMAPFPQTAMATMELVDAPGGSGGPEALLLQVYDLPALGDGASYAAWLFDSRTGEVVPAQGDWLLERQEREVGAGGQVTIRYDTVDAAGDVTSFPGYTGTGPYRHSFRVSSSTLGAEQLLRYTHLFLSLETEPAEQPSEARPVWGQFIEQHGDPEQLSDHVFTSGPVRFGTFMMDPALDRIFVPGGAGEVDYYGGMLRVVLRNLARPPKGFYYKGWLAETEGAKTLPIGPLTAAPPDTHLSLYQADVDTTLPGVTTDLVVRAALSGSEELLGAFFGEFQVLRVTLEPKARPADRMSHCVIMEAPIPDALKAAHGATHYPDSR